ncbi:MAG: ComF family protein [Bacteroidota bacterium]
MTSITQYFEDFSNLFFPKLCYACGEHPIQGEDILCASCTYELPILDYYLYPDNELLRSMEGRNPLETVVAMYTLTEGSRVQRLIYQLKYKNARNVGVELGKTFGQKLTQTAHFQDIDAIVPVPLHPRKLRKRGYNQSEAFSEGLATSMQKMHLPNGLKRIRHGRSLTQKSRQERYETIKEAYRVHEAEKLSGKHILLIDDVLTTGATIEVCARELLRLPDTKVSVAVIAKALS